MACMVECLKRANAGKSSTKSDDCKFRGHNSYHFKVILMNNLYAFSDGVVIDRRYLLWTNFRSRRSDEY